MIKCTISWNYFTQNMMMIFSMLTSRWFKLDWWLPILKHLYKVSTVLFHNNGGANVEVKNFMSHFSMFVPTKATVKIANGNTLNYQWIGIILCRFPNYYIIYPLGPVYYCLGRPSNTISSGALKFYVGFKNVTSEPLEHYDFVDPQGLSWISPYQNHNNTNYLQINIVKVNPHVAREIFWVTLRESFSCH